MILGFLPLRPQMKGISSYKWFPLYTSIQIPRFYHPKLKGTELNLTLQIFSLLFLSYDFSLFQRIHTLLIIGIF